MSNEKISEVARTVEAADEFSNQRVPLSEKRSFLSLLTVSLGYVFVVTSMQVGGSIGVAMNFREGFWAIMLSSVILAVLACIMGVIGAKSGLTLGLLSKYSFGQAGTYVPVAIVAITTIGWFSIDAYLIGQSTNALFTWAPIIPVAILGGIGMTLTALKGMKWMTYLSNLAVPLIVIFGIISMVIAIRDSGGMAAMMNLTQEGGNMGFATAVSLGVGSYAVGAVMFTPDIMRFAKSAKTAVIAMIITMVIGNSFVVLFGAVGAVATGNPDIAYVLAAQNLLAPSFAVLVLNIWSTAQGCVYSGSMSLSSVSSIKRSHLVLGFGAIGIIFAIIGFYNYFGTYINFLASTVPPLAGIFLADYLFVYRQGYPEMAEARLPKVNIGGFLAWAGGFLLSLLPVGMPVVNAVAAAFIIKAVAGMAKK
ncbi:MAG: cytosine permease [Clostridiales bacterium]